MRAAPALRKEGRDPTHPADWRLGLRAEQHRRFGLRGPSGGATLGDVTFGPESLQARGAGQAARPGEVDYRLVRKHTLDEFKRGRLSRLDVCDAHPELLRAARNVGEARSEDCPICDEPCLTLVSFAFGPRLPSHGRCITTRKELTQLKRAPQESTCYVVEVCTACAWNQLVRSFRLGNARPASS